MTHYSVRLIDGKGGEYDVGMEANGFTVGSAGDLIVLREVIPAIPLVAYAAGTWVSCMEVGAVLDAICAAEDNA